MDLNIFIYNSQCDLVNKDSCLAEQYKQFPDPFDIIFLFPFMFA